MTDICLIFEVHQPFRLRRDFNIEITSRRNISIKDLYETYFNKRINRDIFNRISEKCYFPASRIILEQIDKFRGERPFKVSFSFSGIFLEQCEMWNPDLIDLFRQMVKTGCVELIGQTYYHSLASLNNVDKTEFIEQVEMHRESIKGLFNCTPETFENTECIYNNEIAKTAESMGFKTIITEGIERILGWRAPNYVYKAKDSSIRVLLRNYRLSDDIGFRFTLTQWEQWPLTADKYAAWLAHTPGQVIVLFLDYETFGEHYWAESGILEFLRWLPVEVCKWNNLCWSTPSEVIRKYAPCDEIDVPPDKTISWADVERDTSAWLGNFHQNVLFNMLNNIGLLIKAINSPDLLRIWRYLQTSDHFYYMHTKGGGSGIVHDSFNPYGNPAESFITYAGILLDLEARCRLEAGKPEYKYKSLLRRVPPEKGFRFFNYFNSPTDILATSLEGLYEAIKRVNVESIIFHLSRGDFERWVSNVIGDDELAAKICNIPKAWRDKEEAKWVLLSLLEGRLRELKSLVYRADKI